MDSRLFESEYMLNHLCRGLIDKLLCQRNWIVDGQLANEVLTDVCCRASVNLVSIIKQLQTYRSAGFACLSQKNSVRQIVAVHV